MEYVAPKLMNGVVEVEIYQEDTKTEPQIWDNALILYVVGEELCMNIIKNFILKIWNFVKLLGLYYHDEGYFLERFNNHEDRDAVMMKGPYTIRNIPMILKEWRPKFNLKNTY
ncbi:unnamed protein product [Lathyrus sativus]|nr:unnamed protein product [Lathyrus sativus]